MYFVNPKHIFYVPKRDNNTEKEINWSNEFRKYIISK